MKRLLTNDRPASMWLAAFVALLLSIPLYWFMDDDLPRVVYSIRPLNSPVRPGEPLTLLFTGDSFRNCPATVQEELVDGNDIVHKVKERHGRLNVRPGPFATEMDIPTPADAARGRRSIAVGLNTAATRIRGYFRWWSRGKSFSYSTAPSAPAAPDAPPKPQE